MTKYTKTKLERILSPYSDKRGKTIKRSLFTDEILEYFKYRGFKQKFIKEMTIIPPKPRQYIEVKDRYDVAHKLFVSIGQITNPRRLFAGKYSHR